MDDSKIRKIIREQLGNLLDDQKIDLLNEECSGDGIEEVIEMIADDSSVTIHEEIGNR